MNEDQLVMLHREIHVLLELTAGVAPETVAAALTEMAAAEVTLVGR